jgi:hypothetical protein
LISSKIKESGFSILDLQHIGHDVYTPLANYYLKHRKYLQAKIKTKYSASTEKILFESLKKMKHASELDLIDYILLKCT